MTRAAGRPFTVRPTIEVPESKRFAPFLVMAHGFGDARRAAHTKLRADGFQYTSFIYVTEGDSTTEGECE